MHYTRRVALPLVAISALLAIPGIYSFEKGTFNHMQNPEEGGPRLFQVLSKLHPIERWKVTSSLDDTSLPVPRYCWNFFRADPGTTNQISAALRSFRYRVKWEMFSEYELTCIGAIPIETSLTHLLMPQQGTAKIESHDKFRQEWRNLFTSSFISEATDEVIPLSQHLERQLALSEREPKRFTDQVLTKEGLAANPRDEMADFVEPGMHVTWLVQHPRMFARSLAPTSRADRSLHFGVNRDEWVAIYYDALGLDRGAYSKWSATFASNLAAEVAPLEFDEEIAGYPMLSRIKGYLHDANFEGTEVEALRQECLRLQNLTTNALALRGLDKLLRMATQAQKLGQGIYLLSQ